MEKSPDQTLRNSKIAYEILRTLYLSDSEEGLYSKQITEELDASQNSVNNFIKSLRDNGLIKRTKRTRAQYYDIDLEGIYQNWLNHLLNELEANKQRDIPGKWIDALEEAEQNVENFRNDEEIQKFFTEYLKNFLEETEESDINMLYEKSLLLGLMQIGEVRRERKSDKLTDLLNALLYVSMRGNPFVSVVSDAINEVEWEES